MLGRLTRWWQAHQWFRYYRGSFGSFSWDEQCPECHGWYRGDQRIATVLVQFPYFNVVCKCGVIAAWDIARPTPRLIQKVKPNRYRIIRLGSFTTDSTRLTHPLGTSTESVHGQA